MTTLDVDTPMPDTGKTVALEAQQGCWGNCVGLVLVAADDVETVTRLIIQVPDTGVLNLGHLPAVAP